MGEKLSGKDLAKDYRELMKSDIKGRVELGTRPPTLASIIVGEDGGSISYVKNQQKLSEEIGINYRTIKFEDTVTEKELLVQIGELNRDNTVDGIMIQLPLPNHLNVSNITEAISYKKDVDGLTDVNFGRFYKGEKSFTPCTAKSVLHLIKSKCEDIKGKKAVVVGRSNIVGKPAANLLLNESATITVCHSKTVNLKAICKEADILVVALGRPGFINNEYVKSGAIVIDVGTTMVEGKVKGDVEFDDVIDTASYVSPVPGGVGAMTSTLLMNNTYEAWLENVQ